MNRPLRVLSLGLGTQSSAYHLAARHGEIEPFDMEIFADTMCESQDVYEWKAFLEGISGKPFITTSHGNLEEDTLRGLREGTRFSSLPLYTLSEEGKAAPISRQCTFDYKIAQVRREIRRQLGYSPTQKIREKIEIHIGFSIDERRRMDDSQVDYATNKYELITELWWHRAQCADYVYKLTGRRPPKSACRFCPFRSNEMWRLLRDNYPDDWRRAIDFDKAIRRHPYMKGDLFLHPSLVPLDEADINNDLDQGNLFSCSGVCST